MLSSVQALLSRRQLLFALGLSGLIPRESLGAPAGQSPAGAQKADSPLRFIGVYMPHGVAHELWQPGPDFCLTYPACSLAPFDDGETYGRSFRDKLTVIDGLDLAAGIEVGTVGHEASRVILTGSGANGKTPSLDQFLAVEQTLGASTPVTTLTLGVGDAGSGLGSNISYTRGGSPVPKIIDPRATFDELFGKPLSGKERVELEEHRQRRLSVLDLLNRDLASLKRGAPIGERVKLDQHLTALREVEKRLSPAKRECVAPSRPDSESFPKLRAYGGGERYFETITELQVDLLARAMACDLTRFATLFLADLSRTDLYDDLPRDVHTDVAHLYSPKTERGPGNPETWYPLARQNRHTHAQLARLMQRLDEAGLLDDTVIYATSDMGDPARHSSRNVPTLLCGSRRLAPKMGQYVDLRTRKNEQLIPHNRLLVSICQAFGVETDRFGNSAKSSTVTGTLDWQP